MSSDSSEVVDKHIAFGDLDAVIAALSSAAQEEIDKSKVQNKVLCYIDKSVLVENRPLIKFIRNYIQDSSGEFSISALVRISMTSFPTLTLLFVQKYFCLYNKKKITR